MSRHIFHLIIDHPDHFKRLALRWADRNFDTVCYLDNNHYGDYSHHTYEGLIAAGAGDMLRLNCGDAFARLKEFYDRKKDWLFGFLGYDLKNEIEKLQSSHHDGLTFPDLFFFQPEIVIEVHQQHAVVHSLNAAGAVSLTGPEGWNSAPFFDTSGRTCHAYHLHPRISRETYLKIVRQIHKHIARGDIYEMNFCQEFFAERAQIHPMETFIRLNELSKAPFSCYLKFDGKYLLSASPERFLKKQGKQLISMPVKGTARRGRNPQEDEAIRNGLLSDRKERSENVMIVDLVRNDLSRSCVAGSVKAEELFGIKTFEQVHQIVSTISGTLRDDVHFIDAISNAFPMGSMTGAPKVRAMELIEEYEQSKRGLYSGAAGYITPGGDFDFNVVIRSLLYNSSGQYLSFQAGSAIVFDSVPEKEYEECLLKAKALKQSLLGAEAPA